MLPINKRVKKDAFPEIMKKGRFLHGENFYTVSLDRHDTLPCRLSCVVSSKVEKTSVGRHLLKRKMTAVVERSINRLRPGFSVIIFAKKDFSTLSYDAIETGILELLPLLGYTQ